MKTISLLLFWTLACLTVCTGDEAVDAQLTKAANCFSLNLYKKMGKSLSNMVSSPFSADVLLSMLRAGAGGQTAKELTESLGFENITVAAMEDSFQSQLAKLKSQNGNTLDVANSLWIQESFIVNSIFTDVVKTKFNSTINNVDFKTKSHETTKEINDWTNTSTNGMIPTLFDKDLNPNTIMVLANAMYFNGTWEKKFKTSSTRKGPFYNNNSKNNPSTVELMYQKSHFSYGNVDNYELLEMNYVGGSVSMVILLPKEDRTMDVFEKGLSCASLESSIASIKSNLIAATIPKFEIKSDYNLVDPLKDMGFKNMFEDNADFSGISSNIKVSQAIQKCVVKVHEAGTEAAVVTGLTAVAMSAGGFEEDPIIFKADRPFIFLIREKTSGLVLFIGRVNELP